MYYSQEGSRYTQDWAQKESGSRSRHREGPCTLRTRSIRSQAVIAIIGKVPAHSGQVQEESEGRGPQLVTVMKVYPRHSGLLSLHLMETLNIIKMTLHSRSNDADTQNDILKRINEKRLALTVNSPLVSGLVHWQQSDTLRDHSDKAWHHFWQS